jgi:hypothetical protein
LTWGKKLPRIPLPNINAEAANRPFLAPGGRRPQSPPNSVRSPKTGYQRSMTSPRLRVRDPRPPSPEMSANLDCAFPPFPASATEERRPSTSAGRPSTSAGRNERAPSRSRSRMGPTLHAGPDPPSWEPKSSKTTGGESVLQRLNTLKSGPFAAKPRQDSGESDTKDGAPSGHQRRPSVPAVAMPIVHPPTPTNQALQPTRPSTATSEYSQGDAHQPQKRVPPPRPARPYSREVLSPSFLVQFSAEPVELPAPSEPRSTSALSDGNVSLPVLDPSASSSFSQPFGNTSSDGATIPARSPSLSDGSPLPPRTVSRNGTRMDYRLQDAPPVPRPALHHMHAASDSSSSVTTSHSSSHTSSTDGLRLSQPGSSASSVEVLSPLASALAPKVDDEVMRPAGLNIRNPQKPGMRAELPKSSSPPREMARPAPTTRVPRNEAPMMAQPLESPMDPAMMAHSAMVYEPWVASPEKRPQTADGRSRSMSKADSNARVPSPVKPSVPPTMGAAPSSTPSTTSRSCSANSHGPSPCGLQPQPRPEPLRRSTTPKTSHKPMCRGCGQLIEGKSVKAADGRLTGRWHKACFVCRSCQEPFTTADFYVIDNQPYCEHHYHEKNESLCHGCNRGIEGQYLEATSTTRQGVVDRKYHPRCFTCCQCRMILSDDYFEITGRVYCERHALAAMRAQARVVGPGRPEPGPGSSLNPRDRKQMLAERRTTRLINPMMA